MTDLPSKPHRGRLLDARLHLLDRQLLDDNGDPVGIVDDLELTEFELDKDIAAGTDAPRVTDLLSGAVVATRIFGGEPPRDQLQEIPWNRVASVDSVVKLKPAESTLPMSWVERWLRDRIIKHIPGGRHAAE